MTSTQAVDGVMPRIISVDDHVIEPPTLWVDRLPGKFQDFAPRVVRAGSGPVTREGGRMVYRYAEDGPPCDWWFFEGVPLRGLTRLDAAAGFDRDEVTMTATTYDEIRPGAWQVKPRLEDMDTNWTDASLCFPHIPRFCGQTFLEAADRELGLLCVQAYNDWMVQEWAGDSGGRLIPLCLIPLWDGELAAAEVRRNAARGVRAVAFSEIPARLDLPSFHDEGRRWDPFWAACAETATVVCLHIGSSSRMPVTSSDAPAAVPSALTHINATLSLVDLLYSGILERFPSLKVAYAEGQVGWIPYVLERADAVWEENRAWGGIAGNVPNPPSSYFHRQVYGCFFDDPHGLQSIDAIGEDHITYETDYPHSDGTWPNGKAVAERQMAHLTPDQRYKVLRGNAIDLLGLDTV